MTAHKANFVNIKGILAILVEDPSWPNPANIFVIPDCGGLSLIDVGCPMSTAKELTEIHEGAHLQLGDFNFEVIHTPGHSPGHMSLFERNRGILLPGDLVGLFPSNFNHSVVRALDEGKNDENR